MEAVAVALAVRLMQAVPRAMCALAASVSLFWDRFAQAQTFARLVTVWTVVVATRCAMEEGVTGAMWWGAKAHVLFLVLAPQGILLAFLATNVMA